MTQARSLPEASLKSNRIRPEASANHGRRFPQGMSLLPARSLIFERSTAFVKPFARPAADCRIAARPVVVPPVLARRAGRLAR